MARKSKFTKIISARFEPASYKKAEKCAEFKSMETMEYIRKSLDVYNEMVEKEMKRLEVINNM